MFNFIHFRLALSFYTRLPVGSGLDYSQLPRAIPYLPLVGWLVGCVSAGVFYSAQMLWPVVTALVLTLIAGVLCTGGLHEDGLADCCDGFGGGYNQLQILEIMKDPRMGVYGGLGLSLALLLKINALHDLPTNVIPKALIVGHSLSRLAPLYLMYRYDYVRSDTSKSQGVVSRICLTDFGGAALYALLPLLLLPLPCILVLLPFTLAVIALGGYFNRHIGGYTGDCLGASQQLGEIIIYLGLVALWTFI